MTGGSDLLIDDLGHQLSDVGIFCFTPLRTGCTALPRCTAVYGGGGGWRCAPFILYRTTACKAFELTADVLKQFYKTAVAAARAVVATGAWVKSKHDMYVIRGSVGS